MAINRVQQAIEEYTRVVKNAASEYEDALRKAELDLRSIMNSSETPEPPVDDKVTMSKGDYDLMQDQLAKVAEFIKKHPEIDA